MSVDDVVLRESLQQAQRRADGEPSDFDSSFGAAEAQVRFRRRTWRAGLAAAILLFAVTFVLLPTKENELIYIDINELQATTYWLAPSDSLLPEHRFDIYRELPRIFESTEPGEGTLL